jgi:hypothetical protein
MHWPNPLQYSCQLVRTWEQKKRTLLGSITRQWLVKTQKA